MLAIFNFGGGEIILILAGALLLFGGKKLPELAKGLGNGIREFKKATSNVSDEMRHVMEDTLPTTSKRLLPAATDTERSISQVATGPKTLPAPTPDLKPATVHADIKC